MAAVEGSFDESVVKALAHPLRSRLLTLLNQKVASPSDLAEELGEPLGNVSYHVRMLADLGCVELVRTTPRRGALEHHYKAIVRPMLTDKQWGDMPQSLRSSVTGGVLTEAGGDVRRGIETGAFDRENVHLSRTGLLLDRQGLKDLAGVIQESLDSAFRIQAESAARLESNGEEPASSATLVMMLFELDEEEKKGKAKKATASDKTSKASA